MGCGLNLAARFFTFCLVGAVGLSQSRDLPPMPPPNARHAVPGSTTVVGYRLSVDARAILSDSGQVLVRLPSVDRQGVAELAGMLQQGADIELFLGWEGAPDMHLAIFRGRRGAEAALVHDFTLDDDPGIALVSFFQPPDARDTPKVLIDTSSGGPTSYSNTYLLAPDRQSVENLFNSSGYEFADLGGDGIYELIALDGRWSTPDWCLDLFGFAFYPRIFVRDGAGYRMAWPPDSGDANSRVVAFADLRGDGAAELIVLQDRMGTEPTTQALAIYRLDKTVFRLVVEVPFPAERIAFPQIDIRKSSAGQEIRVRTGPPAAVRTEVFPPVNCNPEGPGTAETTYILRGDNLQPVQP
jgi:hypothetical protein